MGERPNIDEPSWFSIASSLLEGTGRPAAVLDLAGTVRAVNRCLGTLLGREPDELIGSAWPERDARQGRMRALLRRLRGGRAAKGTDCVTSGAGVALTLELEAARVGAGRRAAVLLSVVGCRLGEPDGAAADEDLEYLIRRRAASFGEIVTLRAGGHDVPAWRGMRCFEVIQGREAPCEGCPAVDLPTSCDAKAGVLRLGSPAVALGVVTARAVDSRTVRVTRFPVDDALLTRLVEAKARALADRAGLSPREREVFGEIVLGRDSEQIANRLGISARTVKFHQTRALEKLGAESRVDLLRLLF